MAQKAVKIADFFGLVNTLDPLQSPRGSMVQADNIDIDSSATSGGSIHRREGYTKVATLTNVQSVFAPELGDCVYAIANGELLKLDSSFSSTVLKTGVPNGEYHWEEVGPRVYICGPEKMVIDTGVVRPWGIEVPDTPVVTAIAGSLPKGRYFVTCTFTNEWGEESASPIPAVVELEDDQALSVQVPSLADHTTNLYVSPNNADTMYQAARDCAGTFEYDGPLEHLVYPLSQSQFQTNPPPKDGYNLTYHDGRMHVVEYDHTKDISYVYRSELFWLALFNLFEQYDQIPGEVRILHSYSSGVLIATDREIYVYSDTEGLTRLAQYGVPRGYQVSESPTGVVYFWTNRGLCRVPEFRNLTEDRVSVPPGDYCTTVFVEKEGYNKVLISTTNGGKANNPYS